MNSKLHRSLASLLKHNKNGSFATHQNRSDRLFAAFNQLHELGYKRIKNVNDLKTRHIDALVRHWKANNIAPGTIKNRMSDLRWIAEKIDKQNIVKSNDAYEIERRKYVDNNINIAKKIEKPKLERITNDFVSLSLRLQASFGMRREESIKFQIKIADKGSYVYLKASWCKGGRTREIPILTEQQRDLLNEIREFCLKNNTESLIPNDKSYYQQLRAYEYQISKVKMYKNHGLRHQYVQDRYKELTGWECPKRGGLKSRRLNSEQKKIDYQARMQISNELGHGREYVTAQYLGR